MLTPPSKGFYQTLLGEFYFATLEGAAFVSWTYGGVYHDIGFTWDLVDDLDSWRSFHDDF